MVIKSKFYSNVSCSRECSRNESKSTQLMRYKKGISPSQRSFPWAFCATFTAVKLSTHFEKWGNVQQRYTKLIEKSVAVRHCLHIHLSLGLIKYSFDFGFEITTKASFFFYGVPKWVCLTSISLHQVAMVDFICGITISRAVLYTLYTHNLLFGRRDINKGLTSLWLSSLHTVISNRIKLFSRTVCLFVFKTSTFRKFIKTYRLSAQLTFSMKQEIEYETYNLWVHKMILNLKYDMLHASPFALKIDQIFESNKRTF